MHAICFLPTPSASGRDHHRLPTLWALLFLGLLGLCFCGCGKMPVIHYYDLRQAPVPPVSVAPKYQETIAVAGFTASFSYRQSRLLYREESRMSKLGFYEDRRWSSAPTELLTQATITHLRQCGLFSRVTPSSNLASIDFLLRGRITELEELDKADGYHACVGLEMELFDVRQKQQIVWSGAIRRERKTLTRDVDVIANELALAVGEALQELATKLDTALSVMKH